MEVPSAAATPITAPSTARRELVGTLVFKFQKPSDVFGTPHI